MGQDHRLAAGGHDLQVHLPVPGRQHADPADLGFAGEAGERAHEQRGRESQGQQQEQGGRAHAFAKAEGQEKQRRTGRVEVQEAGLDQPERPRHENGAEGGHHGQAEIQREEQPLGGARPGRIVAQVAGAGAARGPLQGRAQEQRGNRQPGVGAAGQRGAIAHRCPSTCLPGTRPGRPGPGFRR